MLSFASGAMLLRPLHCTCWVAQLIQLFPSLLDSLAAVLEIQICLGIPNYFCYFSDVLYTFPGVSSSHFCIVDVIKLKKCIILSGGIIFKNDDLLS